MSAPVLVTGGCGFIGSWTVRELVRAGYGVRVLDNLSAGKLENIQGVPGVDFINGDILDEAVIAAATKGVSGIIHLAAQVSVASSIREPIHSLEQNIAGFLRVLECARQHSVPKLVYASSAAVYGVAEHLPLSENSNLRPISPYGLEKFTNERYADLYASLHGLNAIGLRYFNVYGPRQDPASEYAGVISKFTELALMGEGVTIYGDGLQERDFIYVGDVARANRLALEADFVGVGNVATGNSLTLLDLVRVLSRLVGRQIQCSHELARCGDIRESRADASLLYRRIGFQSQTTIEQGMTALIEFLHRSGSGDSLEDFD